MNKQSLIPRNMLLLDPPMEAIGSPSTSNLLLTQAMEKSDKVADLEEELHSLTEEDEAREHSLKAEIKEESDVLHSMLAIIRRRKTITVSTYDEFTFVQGFTTSEKKVIIAFGTPIAVRDMIQQDKEEKRVCIVENERMKAEGNADDQSDSEDEGDSEEEESDDSDEKSLIKSEEKGDFKDESGSNNDDEAHIKAAEKEVTKNEA